MRKIVCLLLLLPFLVQAQYPPKPINYVTDETGVLSAEQTQVLNTTLKLYEDSTSNQLFVYLSKSLNGKDIQQYSQEIFHEWKIGQKGKNNGLLITVFINDHKFRIHTGYGMEGALPDLLTKKIQDEIMRPQFKSGDYFEGIKLGIDKLIYYSNHDYVPEVEPEIIMNWQSWVVSYSFNIVMLFLYLRNLKNSKKNKKQKKQTSSNKLKVFFVVLAVIIALFPCIGAIVLFFMVIFTSNTIFSSKGSSYSSSSDSSSWSSSDSSSSSSDFGGGGGGDSGGGGSSSDW